MRVLRKRLWLLAIPVILVLIVGMLLLPSRATTVRAEELKKMVSEIDRTVIEKMSDTATFYSCYPSPLITPEDFHKVTELGPGAIPFMLEAVEQDTATSPPFMASAAIFLMGVDLQTVQDYTEWREGSPKEYVRHIRAAAAQLPTELEAIASSGKSKAEKLEALNRYGTLALPLVAERIRKGETYWLDYVAAQIMDTSADHRMAAMTAMYETRDWSISAKQAHVADDFNPEEWLHDQADTLQLMQALFK